MAGNLELKEEPRQTLSMHPGKFALWLFILTVIMLFAAFTSAYIVRQSDGNWLEYNLPTAFWYTSAIIIASSTTLHGAYLAARRDELHMVKFMVAITTVLGLAFLAGQYISWSQLVDQGVYFVGNPAGSFLYVITGVHAVHLIGGIIFLLFLLRSTFKYQVHSKNLIRIEMCATYWHFLDGLWLYLFIFLLLNH